MGILGSPQKASWAARAAMTVEAGALTLPASPSLALLPLGEGPLRGLAGAAQAAVEAGALTLASLATCHLPLSRWPCWP
eukprot:scaffold92838_cov30-Tisochrysis_lutea.AAC.1